MDLAELRLEHFEPHVDSDFACGEQSFHLREAKALGAAAMERPPFSLLFGGPEHVAQGTYLLEHPTLGELTLFLVPVAVDRYEAIFA